MRSPRRSSLTRCVAAAAVATVLVLGPSTSSAQGRTPAPRDPADVPDTATRAGQDSLVQRGVVQQGAPRQERAGQGAAQPGVVPQGIPEPVRAIPAPITRGSLTRRDAAVVGGLTAVAVALFPLDEQITSWLRAPQRRESAAWQNAMDGAEWGVEKGSIIAGGALWVTGLALRQRPVAEMGIHSLAAVVVANQSTMLLKGAFGRSRPYSTADTAAGEWAPGSGFGESARRSFPSGHTSQAFAFAATLSHELSATWPRVGRIATPLLYAGAATVGVARIYNDKHWASDVTVGAAIGILSSRATMGYLHGRPGNVFDRLALNAQIVPQRGGATLALSVPAP